MIHNVFPDTFRKKLFGEEWKEIFMLKSDEEWASKVSRNPEVRLEYTRIIRTRSDGGRPSNPPVRDFLSPFGKA